MHATHASPHLRHRHACEPAYIRFLLGLFLLSGSIALLSVAWLAFVTIQSERSITAATLSNELTITAALTSVPVLADQHLALMEHQLDSVVRIASVASDSLQRTSIFAVKKLDGQLARANRSVSQVSGAVAVALPAITKSADVALVAAASDLHKSQIDFHAIAVPIAVTASHVADAAPMFTDCAYYDAVTGEPDGGNEDCFQNRWVGVSKATERTMQVIAKSAPQMADSGVQIEDSFKAIAGDARREADAITAPKRWYQKVGAVLVLAGFAAAHLI